MTTFDKNGNMTSTNNFHKFVHIEEHQEALRKVEEMAVLIGKQQDLIEQLKRRLGDAI